MPTGHLSRADNPDGLSGIRQALHRIEQKLELLMTEDAAVQAVTAGILADEQAITTALGTIQAALTAAQGDAVQPSTLAALQSAQAALDALTATANTDATPATPAGTSATPPASTTGTPAPAAG